MRARTGLALLVAGVLCAAAGWHFGPGSLPGAAETIEQGQLLFPGLATRLQDAAELDVTHKGNTLVVRRDGGTWGLADRGGYPVQPEKLRGMLTALTELRLVAARTAQPDEWARLGVEDPADPKSGSNLVRVLDAAGKPIAALIVGHRRVLTQGDVPDEVYVRRPGEAQSWLAEGSLTADADPQQWLMRDILNIDHARIARVAVDRDGKRLALVGKDGKLTLSEPAEHAALDPYKLDSLARGLEQLTCEDVHPGAAPATGAIGETVFTTTDGTRITVRLFRPGKALLARFAVTGGDAAKSAALQKRIGSWTYELGAWKEGALVPTLADLEKKPEEKSPAAGVTQ